MAQGVTIKTTLKTTADQKTLLDWYKTNKRPLPWRKNREPYSVWISEIMLQQTTVTAVIPYYEKFMKIFPTLKDLASAPESKVIKNWAGLGYYSRARNLYKAALILNKQGFPKTYKELLKLPGFGPYTSRAVSSIAFNENTGVLDGNVIRVLSRKNALLNKWWTTAGREELQNLSDQIVSNTPAHKTNQALMELGSTICTPSTPTCFLCPWLSSCKAHKQGDPLKYPHKRPKRPREIWHWNVKLIYRKNMVVLLPNTYTPFLKKQWIYPGTIKPLNIPPKSFNFKHSITHHDIHVSVEISTLQKLSISQRKESRWFEINNISEVTPSSLIKKILETH